MADQQVKIIQGDRGQYKIDLPQSSIARVDIVDIDFIIQMKNGERMILAGAALDATGDHPPSVVFSDGTLSASKLFFSVDKVQTPDVAIPAMASLVNFEAKKGEGQRAMMRDGGKGHETDAHDPTTAPGDQSAETPPSPPAPAMDQVAPLNVPPQSSIDKILSQAAHLTDAAANKNTSTAPAAIDTPPPPAPNTNAGAAPATTTVLPTLDVYLGNVVASSSLGGGNGSDETIWGGVGVDGSQSGHKIGPSDPLQIAAPTLVGGSGNNTIYGDAAQYTQSTSHPDPNQFAKELSIKLGGTFSSSTDITVTSAGGLPAGFSINGATSQGTDRWSVSLANQTADGVAVDLVYDVQAADPNNPIHNTFTLTFSATLLLTNGQSVDLSQTVTFEVKDVLTATDL